MTTQYISRYEEGEDVINIAIGVIDVIVGIIIILSSRFGFASNALIIFGSFLYFFLGILSLSKSFTRKYLFDWKGYVNMISAVSLILIYYGIFLEIFKIFGIIVIIKGIISIFLVTTKE